MRLRLILLFLLCFSINCFSQESSRIDFKIKNLGVNVDGHFNTFTINADFDSNKALKNLSGTITVASIKTGIESRDKHLLEDYFNAEKYKHISLKSISISKKSAKTYVVKASLTIKGKTKEVTLPVNIDNGKITSSFEINRRDFDVGGGSFVMSKTVKIKVVHYQDM